VNDQQDIGTMLADQLDRLMSKRVDREALLAIEAGEFPDVLWQQVETLGVNLALVPENAGGAGLSWRESETLMRTLGRHASPIPLGETMIGAALLAQAGIQIPNSPLAIIGELLQLDDEGRISGGDHLVAWAPCATHLVAEAERKGHRYRVLIDCSSVELTACSTYGRVPSAGARLDAAEPLAHAAVDGVDTFSALAVLRSLQIAGALQAVLALCVEYANTRQQFGKPIGKFQAIQQHLAELALHTAATQVAALFGCRSIDNGTARRGAAIAKIRASAAAGAGAKIAHQIFGAIGITDEHRLHYYTRRLWQWRSEAGSELAWSEELGAATLKAGGARLWADLVR
jgi:acyl-CoA dehydrogenase